jgi:FemAB-related protein (PEP-CTERM system-associated)
MRVRELAEADSGRWDQFVERCPEATFFHLSGWKQVLERAFGHDTMFLYAEHDGQILGILPLARVRSLLFGDSLTSLPFCVYGGIAAVDDAARTLLREHACALAERLQVDALELRNQQPSGLDWPRKDLYATFKKTIEADDEANLKAIPNKQRAMVRKGIKSGLVGEAGSDGQRLFRVYSESVRNLGTPVFSANYFRILADVFGDACDILMITHQGRDIAGVLSFWFRNEVLPYYGGSVRAARDIKGSNDFMYWDLMCRARERGCTRFDFGRSKQGTGPYSFKKNWGFKPQPLHYEYHLVKSSSMPDVNPMNPKYQLFIKAWKKLPLPVANFLGPVLAKDLG